jgi:Rod binding domain-containing protein
MDLKVTNTEKHIDSAKQLVNSNMTESQKSKLAEAAKGFESMLTSMMLKSMSSTEGGMFGEDSYGGDYYDSIFQTEIANKMSSGKGLGVADVIYMKMTGEKMPDELKNIKLSSLTNSNKNNSADKLKDSNSQNSSVNSNKKVQTGDGSKIKISNVNSSSSINPSEKSMTRLNKYDDYIEQAAQEYGVDENLIRSVIMTESNAQEKAHSKCHAKGLMQLLDGTAKSMGAKNVWDPKQNIMAGTKYLSGLLRQYNGDVKLALAGYNAGPGAVNKYNGVPPYTETKNYITRVLGYYNHFSGASNESETIE